MGRVEDRLTQLGLTVPTVAAPVAAYVPALRDGRYVYVSGQLPVADGALLATGRVAAAVDAAAVDAAADGATVSPEQAKKLARICALNAIAACKSVVGDLDRVERVVKLVGFVASEPSFTGQPGVVNGASELMQEVFGDAGAHARSAVGVVALPLGAPVEVEAIFAVRD